MPSYIYSFEESPLIVIADEYNGPRVVVNLRPDATDLKNQQFNNALFEYSCKGYTLIDDSRNNQAGYEFRTQGELKALAKAIENSGLFGAVAISSKITHFPVVQDSHDISSEMPSAAESPFVIISDKDERNSRRVLVDLLPDATDSEIEKFTGAILVYAAQGHIVRNDSCDP